MKYPTARWLLNPLVAIAGIIVALIIGLGPRYLWGPNLVYEVSERETVFGPKIAREIAVAINRQFFETWFEDAQEKLQKAVDKQPDKAPDESGEGAGEVGKDPAALPADVKAQLGALASMSMEPIKSGMSAARLFPDKYVKVRLRNWGRGPARKVKLIVTVPGVIAEKYVECPSYPQIEPKFIYAMDDAFPVGLQIDGSQIDRISSGKELSIEVWYGEGKLKGRLQTIFPDWPEEVSAEIDHEGGNARRVESVQPSRLIPTWVWVIVSFWLVMFISGYYRGIRKLEMKATTHEERVNNLLLALVEGEEPAEAEEEATEEESE